MALNTLFPRQKELVNYDYFDVAEGVGYVIYFGANADDGEYTISTTNQIYSESIATWLQDLTLTGSFVKRFDLDFDLTFNRPKNIKGVILVNVPIGVSSKDSTEKSIEYYAVVKVYHYDGSSETLLGTGTSQTITTGTFSTSTRSYSSMVALFKINVAALTHFKKGETLRFSVAGWFRMTSGSGLTNIMITHDPKNREWKAGARADSANSQTELANEKSGGGTVFYQNTQMIFHVPFVLDI